MTMSMTSSAQVLATFNKWNIVPLQSKLTTTTGARNVIREHRSWHAHDVMTYVNLCPPPPVPASIPNGLVLGKTEIVCLWDQGF